METKKKKEPQPSSMDDVLKRMLSTPPIPKRAKPVKKEEKKPRGA